MKLSDVLLAGAAALSFVTPADAGEAEDLAAKFGQLEDVDSISLSPDGSHFAIVNALSSKGEVALVSPTTGGITFRAVAKGSGDEDHLQSCSWPTDLRLFCRYVVQQKSGKDVVGYSRVVAVDRDGQNFAMVTIGSNINSLGVVWNGGAVIDWNGSRPGTVLMTRQFVPEMETGKRTAQRREGLGVEEVDAVTLKRALVEPPRHSAAEFITDGHGTVRIRGIQPFDSNGNRQTYVDYTYRPVSGGDWKPLGRYAFGDVGIGFNPYAVDRDLDAVYGFAANEAGFRSLYRMKLDGSGTRELLLGRNDVDIDGVIRIGRNQRVVGASYATDRRQVEYFDAELRKLGTALEKTLPGRQIGFVDSSADENILLILASSDVDPGVFYRFDKRTRHLDQLLLVRPALEGMKLAEMKPISFPAADGTMVPGYLTVPVGSSGRNLPAIVMPHGGPSARDEWGFDWLVQFFAARGYAVLQPNYRGSDGYGAGWYQKNGFKSWRAAIGDIDDAGRWLVSQGIAAADKLAIVGWSYGGYAALQSAATSPGLYKAVVAIAPVTDLQRLKNDHRAFTDYLAVTKFVGEGEHVRSGSPAQSAAAIRAPVLMFHGDMDANVNIGHSRMMAERLKDAGRQVELVEFPALEHSLGNAAARTRLLSQSDSFLRQALGLAP